MGCEGGREREAETQSAHLLQTSKARQSLRDRKRQGGVFKWKHFFILKALSKQRFQFNPAPERAINKSCVDLDGRPIIAFAFTCFWQFKTEALNLILN